MNHFIISVIRIKRETNRVERRRIGCRYRLYMAYAKLALENCSGVVQSKRFKLIFGTVYFSFRFNDTPDSLAKIMKTPIANAISIMSSFISFFFSSHKNFDFSVPDSILFSDYLFKLSDLSHFEPF